MGLWESEQYNLTVLHGDDTTWLVQKVAAGGSHLDTSQECRWAGLKMALCSRSLGEGGR